MTAGQPRRARVVDLHPRTRAQLAAAVIAETRILVAKLDQHEQRGYRHIRLGALARLRGALLALDRHDDGVNLADSPTMRAAAEHALSDGQDPA